MTVRKFQQKITFSEGGGLRQGWFAAYGVDPVGPVRMFQWEAINDMPAAAAPEVADGGYWFNDPFRVQYVPDMDAAQ